MPPPANDDFEFIAPPPKTRGNLALKPVAEEAAYDCPIRFPGQWQDAETGLYYNRHRYYDPLAAQYTSPDPIGLEGGARPQGYVDCPNVWVDPFGLAAKRTNLPAERYPPREGAIGVWKEKTFFPGERFDRYGYPGGRYTADVNTPFPNRALGPESLQMPYQVYEVVKPFGAIKSYTASWFGQPGGGIQYITPVPLSTLLKRGIIRKVN